MKFGIENYILTAPFSLIFSILIFFGTAQLGFFFYRFKQVKLIFNSLANEIYVAPILGASLLILLISPLVLIGYSKVFFFRIIGTILILLSLPFLKKIFNLGKINKEFYLPLIFLFAYFLLCFAPITSGDSLDYHTEVAIHILNYGSFPIDHFWFHSRQAGYGEILISLGLANGAEQYGSLIQFAGLLVIFGMVKKQIDKNKKLINNYSLLFALLSSPILIFLISTNKPQLMSSGLLSMAFCIVFFYFRQLKDLHSKYVSFIITNILLILAYHIKFSSVVGIFLIWSFLIIEIYKSNLNFKIISFLQIVLGIFFVLPYLHWKNLFFGGNYFQNFFYALPIHLYGYENLWESVSSCGYYCGFPIWFVFPQSLSQATQTLGISSILVLFYIFLKNFEFRIKFIVIFYVVIFLSFGQHNARFFVDPFFWTILALSKNYVSYNFLNKYKILNLSIYAQSVLTLSMIIVGIGTLSVGGLSENLRKNVLKNHGYNYELINWTNNNLKKDSVLLTFGSKNAYLKMKSISLYFLNYSHFSNPNTKIYLSQIAQKKPTHVLFVNPTDDSKKEFMINCLDVLEKEDKNVGSYSGRNPFKLNKQKYNAEIYKLNTNVFPDCLD